MKRTILIELILLITLSALIAVCIYLWKDISVLFEFKDMFEVAESLHNELFYGIISLIGIVGIISVIILIALKDFKPLADKLQARKSARAQAKAERAEAGKQAKISELEKQLEALKKD